MCFDCSGAKHSEFYDDNTRKLSIYTRTKSTIEAKVTIMIDELTEVPIIKPEPYPGNEKDDKELYKLELVRFVKDKTRLKSEIQQLYLLVIGQCMVHMVSNSR